jgi:uncharacterized protein (TIGR00369 family)
MSALQLDNPLLEHLGVRLVRWGAGECEFQLDIGARHLNRQSSLQGGVAATLLDAACGYAGLKTSADATSDNALTVMLAISYIARATTGRVRAIGKVSSAGRKLYFAAAELITEDGRLIATAQGTFKRSTSALSNTKR